MGEGYESWRWGYFHGNDYAGDQSIKKETAISKAIEIVICDQVCDRDQVDVYHTM